MPFRSTAQQRFMYARHPEIAERWTKEMKRGKKGYARAHPIKAAGLPKHVRKAASSGTFVRDGSTVVPMSRPPARRGKVGRGSGGGYARGSRFAKGLPFTPTPTLMQQGKPPSVQGAAGSVMGTLAGQRTGAPQPRAQAVTGAAGQQAARKPAQIGQGQPMKTAGSLIPVKPQKPQVAKDYADGTDRPSKKELYDRASQIDARHPDRKPRGRKVDELHESLRYKGRHPRRYDPEAQRQRQRGAAGRVRTVATFAFDGAGDAVTFGGFGSSRSGSLLRIIASKSRPLRGPVYLRRGFLETGIRSTDHGERRAGAG